MAFSHINLDAPGTQPGRNDPCPCGSGKKTKRCCGVDHGRFVPLRGRHRGVVPVDLAARVDEMAGDFTVRFLARSYLPARLERRIAWPDDYAIAIGVSGVHATKTGNAKAAYNRLADAMRPRTEDRGYCS